MPKMKVAIVLNTSWNIQNFRMGLIKSLQDQGIEVYAIAPKDNSSQYLIEQGCNFIEIKMDSRGANPLKDLALTFELYNIYRRIKPDLIFHFTIKPNIFGTFAASLLRIPVVNNVCGLGTVFLQENLISKVGIWLYRLAFRFPKKIFFQNPEDRDLFVEKKLVREGITDVLPGSGIDLEKFKPEKSGSDSSNKKFTFLLISRLIYDKGIMEYVEAVRKLKEKGVEAEFQLLGPADPDHKRGITLDILNSWLEGGTVDYLGSTSDVKSFINKADCVVLPSYREGTPRTLLEAASLAKPLIATEVPGCTSVVENNRNGFLCKIKDPADLAQTMEKMLSLDEGSRFEMGRISRTKVENEFSEKFVIDKYLETVGEIKTK